MKNKITALILAVLTAFSALAITSCSEKSGYPVTVAGVKIESEPENIVILSKNYADIISYIGYDEKLVGRSDEVNQKGMHVVPSVGPAAKASVSKIKELKADVVFAENNLNADTKAQLEKNGIKVVIPDKAENKKQLKNLYIQLGTILGGSKSGKEKGRQACNKLLGELDDVKDIVTEKSKNLTICYLYLEKGKLKTMNEGTWGAELLDYTGETNVLKHQKTNAVNPKKLLRSNPDFIFCENRAVADKLRSSNYLKGLSALRGGLRAVAYDEITMQGTTSLYAVKKMLKKMYSEDFK